MLLGSALMRLVKIKRGIFPTRVRCQGCEVFVNEEQAYADLDGVPFIDYYCSICTDHFVYEKIAIKVENEQSQS